MPLSWTWRPPLSKWCACISKILHPTQHLKNLPTQPSVKPGNRRYFQELLTRLAPLPLTSLGVREVSLAQPEEAEGLGSVEVPPSNYQIVDHDLDVLFHGDKQKVAVLTMACLVFLGAFIAVLCICCIKMKRYSLS